MMKNTDENRKKLANLIADSMDIDSLESFVRRVLIERYEEDDDAFDYDLDPYVNSDGEWEEYFQ